MPNAVSKVGARVGVTVADGPGVGVGPVLDVGVSDRVGENIGVVVGITSGPSSTFMACNIALPTRAVRVIPKFEPTGTVMR